MHVNGYGAAVCLDGMGFERLANHWAKAQVGHVMVVHDVKMNPVSAGRDNGFEFVPQTGKIGGQNGRCDTVGWLGFAHRTIVAASHVA